MNSHGFSFSVLQALKTKAPYEVTESYQRFDQKNNMLMRPYWDSSQEYINEITPVNAKKLMERDARGFSRMNFAFATAAGIVAASLGSGINSPNSGLTSWKPLEDTCTPHISEFGGDPAELGRLRVDDAAEITRKVKRVTRFLGADLVGVCELDMRWVYSRHYLPETRESIPVEMPSDYKHVIVMGFGEDYRMYGAAPTPLMMADTLLRYSEMARAVASLAAFIRSLGYGAIPSLNDTALNIPLAIDAGLGQLGRVGLLVTPDFGPRVRLCKVITNLPLVADSPIDFGLSEFCKKCKKCAELCPAKAISEGERTTSAPTPSENPGVLKWYVNHEKCRRYWSAVGTDCGICVRSCPFNKPRSAVHGFGRWLVRNVPSANSLLVKLDNFMGYGKQMDPEFFWDER